MKTQTNFKAMAVIVFSAITITANVEANDASWSVVPFVGVSVLGDQSAHVSSATNIVDGTFGIDVESGFTAGISARYDYKDSPWISEFGWEYRTNDSTTTASDGEEFDSGNYASNTFYLNGRYTFNKSQKRTPWLGGGVLWTQEIDLDSNNVNSVNSFSGSGSVGVQLLAGVDYDITDRFYLTGEMRYSSQTDLSLNSENEGGRVTGMNYQPLTIGIGLGIRF